MQPFQNGDFNLNLTICIVTARKNSCLDWIFASIFNQLKDGEAVDLLVVDSNCYQYQFDIHEVGGRPFRSVPVMPNVWQGKYRLTREDWWAKPSAINTSICYCKTEWILFLDDRSVIAPGFMDAIRMAMKHNYIMFGSYEKRVNMTVEGGFIKNGGIVTGEDSRWQYVQEKSLGNPFTCGGEWGYGCVVLSPLEWLLEVNGSPTRCDGLGFEDAILGLILQNAGYPMYFDRRALLIEDRTPSEIGTPMRRESWEKHPNDTSDKAHTMLRLVKTMKRSDNPYNLRELRKVIQSGGEFPIPDPNKKHTDWFTGKDISTL